MAGKVISILTAPDYAGQTAAAANILRDGGIVLLPTETVYGAAGKLTDAATRTRLRALKPTTSASADAPVQLKPLTLHLAHPNDAARYLGPVSELGQRLMRKLWPGPVGLTFDVPADRRKEVAKSLDLPEEELYDQGTITLRCPDHPVALDVLSSAAGGDNAPIVLTQAPTTHGEPAHKASDITPAATEAADLTLDAGPSRYSKPSTLLHVKGNTYELTRAGVYDQRIIDRMLKTTVLFVCSGNTCRSPMAMALARKIIAEKLKTTPDRLDEKGIAVVSAGSYAMPGSRATPQAVEAMTSMGAELNTHRSRPLTPELIHSADVIYTMGRSHREAVLALSPSAASKVETLDPKGDIEDPIGSDVTVYKSLAGSLEKLIRQRLDERPLQ